MGVRLEDREGPKEQKSFISLRFVFPAFLAFPASLDEKPNKHNEHKKPNKQPTVAKK
jgi:hypothetical protein